MEHLQEDIARDAGEPLRFPQAEPDHVLGVALPTKRLEAAANRGRHGGIRAAEDNLAGGPLAQPSPAIEQNTRDLYRTSQEEEQRMAALLIRAGQTAAASAPRLDPRRVTRRVAQLKTVAPGPNGWRNSYLALVVTAKDGPQILAAWCQAWTQGSISPHIAPFWTRALVRPFLKPDGRSI